MATQYENILFSCEGGIARLTLNRPDRLNSFNDAMHAEVRDAVSRVRGDASLRVLLLTGAGRGFCAGQDLGDPARAVEILGAVVNDGVAQRIDAARSLGPIVVDSQSIEHPQFKDARIRTPLIVKLDAKDDGKYLKEWFGPIAFVIATNDTRQSLDIARRAVRQHGALTLSVYSKDPDVVERAVAAAEDAGVALSINLTGGVFVNQSAAFSDYHGTGANPAANAALTDAAFVASRFRVVQHRMHV